ncbi:MAG: C-GCAxxG-C-C family protein [Clostridiales bacterium]|nr:C-GCAxxG-C-C family protein [Clostridiales bacterium]
MTQIPIPTADQIRKGFDGGINCAQQVAGTCAQVLGRDRDDVVRMAAAFGGGFWRGDNCGAVCGAMMAIGMKYGHCNPGDDEASDMVMAKTKEFADAFIGRNGSLACRDLVQYDFRQEGELDKAFESGRIDEFCPKMVQDALEILEKIL